MYHGRKVAAIIAAAGKGTRLGGDVPKQFIKIGGETILLKTLRVFEQTEEIDYIFIVSGEEYISRCEQIAAEGGISKIISTVSGGRERQDSVCNALKDIEARSPDTSIVLVHDAARPFATSELIVDVVKAAYEYEAAAACVAVKDSLREKNDRSGSHAVDRDRFFSVQTPQGFRRDLLMEAYDRAYADGYMGTDDASLVERTGHDIRIVMGDYRNIKITTREDLPMENRIGTGFDVHRLTEGRKLILGGVEIPYERGLDGHSDADVLIHALMDALLGAAGMGDIGKHFPDSDESYRGISSLKLLKKVADILEENHYSIGNADITLIAQNPKISPYTDEMRANIASVLKVHESRINIKGTTTEKLGFTGRGEGIAAQAVCCIYR